MKKGYFLILIISVTIIIGVSQTVQSQTTMNFTKLFQDKFTRMDNKFFPAIPFQDVVVDYESPTTVLISGDLFTRSAEPNTAYIFNSYLWQAMDMLKNQYGFKVQQVMTSGVGSEGNPTTVYILMTK
jgi:hypothetical protein